MVFILLGFCISFTNKHTKNYLMVTAMMMMMMCILCDYVHVCVHSIFKLFGKLIIRMISVWFIIQRFHLLLRFVPHLHFFDIQFKKNRPIPSTREHKWPEREIERSRMCWKTDYTNVFPWWEIHTFLGGTLGAVNVLLHRISHLFLSVSKIVIFVKFPNETKRNWKKTTLLSWKITLCIE